MEKDAWQILFEMFIEFRIDNGEFLPKTEQRSPRGAEYSLWNTIDDRMSGLSL